MAIIIKNAERYGGAMWYQNAIADEFPLVDFVCFESVQLNEFLNHMIAQNTFFIMVERDAYWTRDSIVLLNLVSEHPRNTEVKHGISIEQLLVDVVAEKTFRLLYSKNEIYRIYEAADRLCAIDHTRLLRYARRRGKAEEIEKYIGGR